MWTIYTAEWGIDSSTPDETVKPLHSYFYKIKQCSSRTGASIGVHVGVVFASDDQEAQDKAWEAAGNDAACGIEIWDIPESGFNYTVYKSEI